MRAVLVTRHEADQACLAAPSNVFRPVEFQLPLLAVPVVPQVDYVNPPVAAAPTRSWEQQVVVLPVDRDLILHPQHVLRMVLTRIAEGVYGVSAFEHDVAMHKAPILWREELRQLQVEGEAVDKGDELIHLNLQQLAVGVPVEDEAKARKVIRKGAHAKPHFGASTLTGIRKDAIC